MELRDFDLEKDYETLEKWAKKRKIPMVPKYKLSPYGLMCLQGKKELGAFFLFPFKGSKWAMIEFLITNPESSTEDRKMVKKLLFEGLVDKASNMGLIEIMCLSEPFMEDTIRGWGMKSNEVNLKFFNGRIK